MKKIKTMIIGFVAALTLFSAVAPSATGVVQANEIKTAQKNVNNTKPNLENKNGFNPAEVQKEVEKFKNFVKSKGIQDINQLSFKEKDALYSQYLDVLGKKREPVSILTILGVITAAITIVGSLYYAGRYAAMQLNSRGWLSRWDYQRNSSWLYWGIVASAGWIVAAGFDDYMYWRN